VGDAGETSVRKRLDENRPLGSFQGRHDELMLRSLSSVLAVIALMGGAVMAMGADTQEPKVNASMLVSSDWLAQHLHDPNLVVLCVAGDRGFYERHIPGARWVPLDRLVTQGATLNAIPPIRQLKALLEEVGVGRNSRIVLYGERQGMLAARAYVTLDYLGLADHAALLDGGIEKWRYEKRDENSVIPKVSATRLELTPNPKLLVALDEMKRHAVQGDATLLDARPRAEYSGEKRSEDVPQSGHIRGAAGLYWVDLLTSREMPTLRSPKELLAAYTAGGASEKREVISYCRTGMQASVDYFVAKYLGFPSRIYVPSFYEYSRSDGAIESSVEQAQPK
jgi:thiosulfate/3-mercaptopyruvate sulfurtransferase